MPGTKSFFSKVASFNNATIPIMLNNANNYVKKLNSVNPNLTNSLVTPNATLTGSNKNTSIETLPLCNFRSGILIMNSSKNNILKVEAQLSALKSYVNCKLSILRNQIESFTEHTKSMMGHENRNIDALHENIAFLQNKLTERIN